MLIDLHKVKLNIATPSGGVRNLLNIPEFKILPLQKTLIKGPSGTGKSTLLHLIAGLMNASEGYLNWDNQRVNLLSDSERSQIRRKKFAIIFQRLNLLEHLSLRENLQLAIAQELKPAEKKQRIEHALESVSLIDRADDYAAVLSLGEQQRLAIARALAQNPEVILADEPTSALDQKNADNCMRALLDASKNSSLIVVSHDERIQKSFSTVQSITEWGP